MLNRIAATQNYTTKEGFSMRRVTFKALAVLVGLAVLALAAPWFGETTWAQQVPLLQGDLVRVLYTSWENGIMADPPFATIMPLPGDLIYGNVPWLSFVNGQPPPVPAEGYCFRVWTGQAEFMGQVRTGVVRYQRATCPSGPGPSQGIAQLTIQPGGCGATYFLGQPVTVVIQILVAGRFRLLDLLPNGLTQVLFDRWLGVGTYLISGAMGPLPGLENLSLERNENGQFQEVARCSFLVVGGTGQTGQVQLMIQARTPNGEITPQMELTINPPTGGWMLINTPYRQSWPQGTRIRLQAPAIFGQWRFDHWEVRRVTDSGQTETIILTQNPLEGTLVSPQVTITAVYVAG
jgi:hypothetical protein